MHRSTIAIAVLAATFLAGEAVLHPAIAQDPQSPLQWASVSAGDVHACALTVIGRAFCWSPAHGGGSHPSTEGAPRPVPGNLTFITISAGNLTACRSTRALASAAREFCFGQENHHTCAVTRRGEAYCWGGNSDGQLGDGTTTNRSAPVRVAGGSKFASISAGDAHTCGVATDGVAYCWGRNASGELGIGLVDADPHPQPEIVARAVRTIAAGGHFSCAVDTKGIAYCWGDNYQSRLGSSAADPVNPNPTPLPVDGGHEFRSISAGETHACGLIRDGTAYCWGGNLNGEIGPEAALLSSTHDPVAVGGPKLTAVTVGLRFHSCGVGQDGKAYCWGRNTEGQLGVGDHSLESCHSDPCSTRPLPVSGNLGFKSLSAGRGFTCGVTVSGELYCWGTGWSGSPGSGGSGGAGKPVRVRAP